MEKNELRIGNLVFFGNKSAQLGMAKLCSVGNNYCDIVYIHVFTEELSYASIEFKRFQPIELTEEWLLKAGFELQPYQRASYTVYQCGEMAFIKEDGEYKFSIYDNKIKYVHQLQNLYFALTGEELTIK